MYARSTSRLVALLTLSAIGLFGSTSGCDPSTFLPVTDTSITDAVLRWNKISIDTTGLDHAPVQAGETRTFGHQLGPTRSSRAMAMAHIAIFDAVNAITGGYESYTRTVAAPNWTSVKAAVAQAAHDTLVSLYPSHASLLDPLLAEDLDSLPSSIAKMRGIDLGKDVAHAIIAMRNDDGSQMSVDYTVSDEPGAWRPDPVNPAQQPLGEEWYLVKPFALNSASQFRCPAPPAMDSAEYTAAYNEVKQLGGDGTVTPTTRTADQTETGIYWAYDGTPSLCAPPRLYNQIAAQIATDHGVTGLELARLLAIVNVCLADATLGCWESKYHYNFWRPVTGIRESDPGTGPSGLGDSNSDTVGDPTYLPLCAPASNLTGSNFTPPFPAYPSGHASMGGALFEVLRNYFGTDDMPFTFVSDEYNGVTKDNLGNTRPLLPRSFTTLSQAEEENGQSRIYLGIHWSFDKSEGISLGRKVADHVFDTAFRPVP